MVDVGNDGKLQRDEVLKALLVGSEVHDELMAAFGLGEEELEPIIQQGNIEICKEIYRGMDRERLEEISSSIENSIFSESGNVMIEYLGLWEDKFNSRAYQTSDCPPLHRIKCNYDKNGENDEALVNGWKILSQEFRHDLTTAALISQS